MKKIGIDARFCTISSTGIGRHTEELIRYLAKFDKNNNYTVFLTSKVAPSFKDLPSNFSLETVSIPHYSWQEQIIFPWKLWRGNFDLMVFPHFNFPLLYMRKFVVTIHDLTLHFYPGAKKTSWWHLVAYKFLISQVAKRSEHIFAVSENTKKDLIKLGSQTAKSGFRNEDDIVGKFNDWERDEDAQKWLNIMGYPLEEIEKVEAIKLHGEKTDVQVQITIYLKKVVAAENLSIKLVSNPQGFNHHSH